MQIKVWKKIDKIFFRDTNESIASMNKKGILASPWIYNIFKKNIKYKKKFPIFFYKIKVKELGFKKATTLDKIYREIKKKNFLLVDKELAIILRLIYKNQKKGEWLRIAVDFNSMIDSDKVPHLPKLGKALSKFFLETYWAYKKAIFHPHNEFIVMKYK